MSPSSRRFNQITLVVISILLVTGSGLLIALGPPPDGRGAKPSAPTLGAGTSSHEEAQPADLDSPADALTPANSQAETLNDSEDGQSAQNTRLPAPDRAVSGSGAFPSTRNSRGSPIPGLVTIRNVPVGDSELEAAWKQAAHISCEFIPPNQPFEITRPTPFLTDNDRRQATSRNLTAGMRQHVLSVGLHMSRQDEQSLPALSKLQILDYIHAHYVTIQARVQRDPVTGIVYLHHRPLAATMQFTGPRLTQEFTDTVARSVHDFRSLGLWLRPGEESTAENLRTLVLADRYETGQSISRYTKPKSACELMFIRARVRNENTAPGSRARSDSVRALPNDDTSDLVLHTFVTTKGRQSLHYIAPDSDLHGSQQCGIRALIRITSFAHGAYPTGSVVVGQEVRSSATYSKDKLNGFSRKMGWTGNCFDHLSQLLDAIINKELTAD